MHRRQFLNASLATSALAASGQTTKAAESQEFYLLRTYKMRSGPQTTLCETFLGGALIPALNRMGMDRVGAFRVDIGPETPTFYVLVPGTSAEALAMIDLKLAADEAFVKAAEPFWSAPATEPSFLRVESELFAAFKGWPKLTPPAKGKRIFQLRTYESPSHRDHERKVEMFHHGEFEIFARAGFGQVFYGDALIGARLPKLTYMLSFPDMAALNERWDLFRNDPEWKKLSSSPRYHFEEIVSNITNLILNPLACSQL